MEKIEIDFIEVEKQGVKHYGGNQRWWKNVNPSLQKYGCGVIAMCNMELCVRSKSKMGIYIKQK